MTNLNEITSIIDNQLQSLNNDLVALRLLHPYIIDTSVISNVTGVRWRKSKLSLLSKVGSNETIISNV